MQITSVRKEIGRRDFKRLNLDHKVHLSGEPVIKNRHQRTRGELALFRDPSVCPYALDESCEGAKDSKSCFEDYNFLNCRVYELKMQNSNGNGNGNGYRA